VPGDPQPGSGSAVRQDGLRINPESPQGPGAARLDHYVGGANEIGEGGATPEVDLPAGVAGVQAGIELGSGRGGGVRTVLALDVNDVRAGPGDQLSRKRAGPQSTEIDDQWT
jgi:hypothetical protein